MLLNASLYAKNQDPKPKTLARTIFFISPYIGLYRAKWEVFKGGGKGVERGFGILKYGPKLDNMPNLRQISRTIWSHNYPPTSKVDS